MQATTTLTRTYGRKLFSLAAAIGLLATLAVIAYAYTSWNSGSGSEAAQRPAVSAASQAAAVTRFQAINELPGSAVSARPAVNYRFLDMNLMPEAATADAALSGQALTRFLEWNLIMPGSEAAFYPAVDRDGQPN